MIKRIAKTKEEVILGEDKHDTIAKKVITKLSRSNFKEKPISLELPLFNYQKDSVQHLLNNKRSYLALDPGLGKTRITIEAIKERIKQLKDVRYNLVVCPASLRLNWAVEIDKWWWQGEQPNIVFLNKITDVKKIKPNSINFIIISYQFLSYAAKVKILKDLLKQIKFASIIADEAHALKNYKAKRTKNFDQIMKLASSTSSPCTYFLSGTPLVNSAEDLHLPFTMLVRAYQNELPFDDNKTFCEKYCYTRILNLNVRGRRLEIKKYFGAKPEVRNLKVEVSKTFFSRLFKKDCLKDLPDKIISDVFFDNPNAVVKGDADKEELDAFLNDIDFEAAPSPAVAAQRIEDTLTKLPDSVDFIKAQFEKAPVVIFAHHKKVISELFNELNKSDKGEEETNTVAVITGDTPLAQRQKIIELFQAGDIKKLICSIQAAGVGITLTKASHVVFVEMPWTQAEFDQASDRCHRIGQKNCVNVYRLILKNSIDAALIGHLATKKKAMSDAVGYK